MIGVIKQCRLVDPAGDSKNDTMNASATVSDGFVNETAKAEPGFPRLVEIFAPDSRRH